MLSFKRWTFFLIFIFAFCEMLILTPIRGYAGWKYSLLVGFILNFSFTLFCLYKYKNYLSFSQITLAIILGASVLEAPMRVLTFASSLISLPDYIFHIFGIIAAYTFVITRTPIRWCVVTIAFSASFFMYFDGYARWLHKLDFGSFTGQLSYPFPDTFLGVNKYQQDIKQSNLLNKIVLLDFWNTSCSVCFEQFPELEKVYKQYSDNPNVSILAINNPLEDDKEGQAFQMIKERNYTFPVLISKQSNLTGTLGITFYPTTLVINKQGTIVFRGRLEYAIDQIDSLLSQQTNQK